MSAVSPLAQASPEPHEELERLVVLVVEGEAAREAGDWARAVAVQVAALALADAILGDSLAFAAVAQNLAVTYKYTGDFAAAEALYLRALRIAEAHGAHVVVAVICHNLGGLAHARGEYAVGIEWARRGLALRERNAPDAVAVAADRGALAALLLEVGEVDEADRLLRAARDTFVAVLGAQHLEVAIVEGNLAAISLRRGHLLEAERLARAAVDSKQAALGSDHPTLAPTLITLGTIRRRQGQSDAALALWNEAVRILRPSVQPDHPLLRTIERPTEHDSST
jgi:tetratricopeptide (TPR) repeat protein